ncbi:queuosine precursor transporter [Treponema phagedenis]|uniref:queuosine precursor transporter n=1 Tax=Treponema phagedenis TaxID=162 RepID=UPI0001F63959|nr:queuosine precursor transporter [Treponema phagedenis]EFW36466.1 putative membrane protein [Treponema phagedenis F0421]
MENTVMQMETPIVSPKKKNFLPVISGLFVGILLLSNILASKMVQLGPFVFDGGTLLFPFSYIFGDVLAEVYGYKDSRKVIWTGFIMLVFMSANIWLVSVLPAEQEWTFQKDFKNILLQMPRIMLGSAFGYFIGEYSNSVVLSKMKVATRGRHLWARTIGSTLVGELLDSVIFVTIAFAGVYSFTVLAIMAFSNYIFKTAIEVVFTPITYKVIDFVKKHEDLDVYDYDVSYSPFPGR